MDGYDHIIVAPQISSTVGPTGAKATLQTVRGIVQVDWALHGGTLMLDVIIPSSVRANVEVPLLGASKETFIVLESDTSVWANGTFVPGVDGVVAGVQQGHLISFEVLSGSYTFHTRK